MHECTYVCIVCMYVCMFVCMHHACMHICMSLRSAIVLLAMLIIARSFLVLLVLPDAVML